MTVQAKATESVNIAVDLMHRGRNAVCAIFKGLPTVPPNAMLLSYTLAANSINFEYSIETELTPKYKVISYKQLKKMPHVKGILDMPFAV